MGELKEISSEFVKANKRLIEAIDDEKVHSYLDSMFHHYSGQNSDKGRIFQYAEIQLGLSKCLDFMLPNNGLSNPKVLSAVNAVVQLAFHIFQYHRNPCANGHEDWACSKRSEV